MSNIHNNGENNKSLNDALDKLGHAYGQLEQDEPPELLDLAISNSAHRAVEKKPHWMKFGWMHGLTTAAVFVLAFSIILNQRDPVPDYEGGLRNNEPVRLQRGKVAKKQSVGESETLPDEPGLDMLQSRPAATAPVSSAMENTPEERVEQPAAEVQRSLYVSDSLSGKSERLDKGARVEEIKLEKEADLMADAPVEFVIEAKAQAGTTPEVEQQLLAIIKLKQSGDESWKAELESFRESYPDYPLPDELKD